MAETFETAIEQAAQLLKGRATGLTRTYGNLQGEQRELAAGWVEIANAITEHERSTK